MRSWLWLSQWSKQQHVDSSSDRRNLQNGVRPGAEAGQLQYLAVVGIHRLSNLRQRLGYRCCTLVMAAVADRVRHVLPSSEIGRCGHDGVEFLFRSAPGAPVTEALRLLKTQLSAPFEVDGFTIELGILIGAAQFVEGYSENDPYRIAASALARCELGSTPIIVAEHSDVDERSSGNLELARDLRRAIDEGDIRVHYQPKLRARTNRIEAVEALVRWQHPSLGMVRPDLFVRVAEDTGLIDRLTALVLAQAALDQKKLAAEGYDLTVDVNVSGELVSDSRFAARVAELVGSWGGRIGFEITETAVFRDPKVALQNLRLWADAGIHIAIDDYGSGLSSLAYLKELPAHELKIDKLFITALSRTHRDPLIVRSSIDLAHALEMEVTAEGVDDPLALSLLKVMGCDLLQGYLISPAVAVDDLVRFLGSYNAAQHESDLSLTLARHRQRAA